MKTVISQYDQQALDFLKETGAEIKVEFLKNGKHFDDDKENRDIYSVTISRGKRSYKFNFGQSIAHSGKFFVGYKMAGDNIHRDAKPFNDHNKARQAAFGSGGMWVILNKKFEIPSAYSILACLEKYDVGTFENFCSEFGYDEDSRKAEKIYKAVLDEYKSLQALFSEEELDKMQEIR
jgi:hypothetical protein